MSANIKVKELIIQELLVLQNKLVKIYKIQKGK